jgi:rubrerythrin
MNEIKNALLIGSTHLISVPNQEFHLWYCRECGNLFNASQTQIFKIISCPICHAKICLGDITK